MSCASCNDCRLHHTQIFRIFVKKRNDMEALRIEILNPKVKSILKQLADLELISISKVESSEIQFKRLLDKFRTKAITSPSLEEITEEIENVRAERYAKEKKS